MQNTFVISIRFFLSFKKKPPEVNVRYGRTGVIRLRRHIEMVSSGQQFYACSQQYEGGRNRGKNQDRVKNKVNAGAGLT